MYLVLGFYCIFKIQFFFLFKATSCNWTLPPSSSRRTTSNPVRSVESDVTRILQQTLMTSQVFFSKPWWRHEDSSANLVDGTPILYKSQWCLKTFKASQVFCSKPWRRHKDSSANLDDVTSILYFTLMTSQVFVTKPWNNHWFP